jgi:PAS domain S-box-containing protein
MLPRFVGSAFKPRQTDAKAAQMETSAVNLFSHRLKTLLEDGEFVLCRSCQPIDMTVPVRSALVVMPRSEHPRSQVVRMLEHEYSLRDALDPVWAVRSVALTTHEGRAALVLDDPGGELLVRRAGTPMDLGDVLRTGAGVAAALRDLHARGLIHKDLKPANVMIDSSMGHVWLRGFGIASRVPRERRLPEPPEVIAGTLAYMAPEQTGWMNRSIDARSDLYALGVVLYELLTGSLPFTASDPMAWVHAHIARRPVPPAERRQDIPDAVSAIVMKLLAKAAEDRYQTAAAVERDLRRCLAHWEAERRVDAFALAEDDTPDRLVIPEKLYGRAREIDTLLGAFERVVASGTPELVLVSGYSGMGKSSVVNELHKVLVPPRGLFASGKFDQYKRDIPYGTLAQAFQTLVRSLLGKPEAALAVWRTALRDALGPNARLIVDVVPELRLIIGEQPPVAELPAPQTQKRFQLVFRQFVTVFARPEHPLVLFVDDLQWIDHGTLEVVEDLLTHGGVQHLLVIGAYRDNEVDAENVLMRRINTIRQSGTRVEEINLAPLARADVQQFVADALRCEPVHADSLAQLIQHKTAGNPFFLIQFLYALAVERLLVFDHDHAEWSWDVDRIRAKGFTDNVVGLLVGKLRRLPPEAQSALQQLSCLGHTGAIAMLSLLLGMSEEQVHADLWEAVRRELVERTAGSYQFVHDRIQEAAYSLIPEDSRPAAHLRIGRLLAAHTSPEQRDEAIFDIVNQLNRGAALITAHDERERLAEFNLIAGQRAKAFAAYASALTYLVAGAELLPEDRWERRHDLTFALELHRAECEYVTAELGAAEERLTALATRAATLVERAAAAGLRVDLYVTLDQVDRAIAVGLGYLRNLGFEWSAHPTEEEVRREYDRIWSQLGTREIEDLIDLPLLSDPASVATLDILTKLATYATITDNNLQVLVACRAVNLSLELGNCDASCVAYQFLAIIAGARFGDYQAGYRFGRLGYEMAEQRGWKRLQPRTYSFFGGLVLPWTRPFKSSRDLLRRASAAGRNIGDVISAGASCVYLNTNMLAAGDLLVEVEREAERSLALAQKAQFGLIVDMIAAQLGLVRTLRGSTRRFGCFDDDQFEELLAERRFASNPNLQSAECWYWIRKLQARFLSGDGAAAVDASLKAEGLLWTSRSMLEEAEYHFYSALARALCWDSAPADGREAHLAALAAHHRQLDVWARTCPENFDNRAVLVGAEISRIEGRLLDAERLYETAIQSAHAQGFIHNEALANEVAARFYAARGFTKIADTYLREARYGYLSWGAIGKVRQLDELYPRLTQDDAAPDPRATIGARVERLELATVLKVSQAVSSEIVLEKVVDTVLRTAIEHAGADRGVLIVPRGDDLRIQAEASTDGSAVPIVLRDVPLGSAVLPESVVRYAARTHETVNLDDASARGAFSSDEYIRRQHARSVLCLPLVQQGRLMALLYLENNLAAGVFTSARMAVLNVLASQAAMSLEKTRLYEELRQREAKIRRLVDANIVGVLISDLGGRVIEANDAVLNMIGYSREDLIAGRIRWTDLTPPEWRAVSGRAVAQITVQGKCDLFEKEYVRKDGIRVPVLIAAAAIDETTNENVAFVLDLTERKQAEEAQKRAEAALQQARAALAHRQRVSLLGEVAASLAHEIKQPIAAARIDAKVCVRALSDDRLDLETAREAAARLVKDALSADEIIKRTTALYKKDTTHRERVDVNAVIREMAILLQQEVGASRIAIRTELAEGMPDVMADRVQLQQVLMNLMLNAIEAMKDTGGELTVTSQLSEDSELLIAVRDTGVGLPTENPHQIFESFVTTKPHGTGMGLAITRSIVESHGGRLWAIANAGPGATFLFTLLRDAGAPLGSQPR